VFPASSAVLLCPEKRLVRVRFANSSLRSPAGVSLQLPARQPLLSHRSRVLVSRTTSRHQAVKPRSSCCFAVCVSVRPGACAALTVAVVCLVGSEPVIRDKVTPLGRSKLSGKSLVVACMHACHGTPSTFGERRGSLILSDDSR